jgi:hypothetical protein
MSKVEINLSKKNIQEILDANGYEIKTLLVYYSPFSEEYDWEERNIFEVYRDYGFKKNNMPEEAKREKPSLEDLKEYELDNVLNKIITNKIVSLCLN